MAEFISAGLGTYKPPVTPIGAETITVIKKISTTTALAINDLLKACFLPAGCRPVLLEVQTTDLDGHGTPELVMDFGIFDADGTTLGTVLINDSTVGQAGGDDVLDAATLDNLNDWTVDYINNRYVGGKIIAAAATPAAGSVYVKFQYCAA
jgi:hypothetical protein